MRQVAAVTEALILNKYRDGKAAHVRIQLLPLAGDRIAVMVIYDRHGIVTDR